MCGGGQDDAQKEAAKREEERQTRIANTTSQINAIYDAPGRESQYRDFIAAVRDKYGQDLNRQQAVNSRQLKFSLARSGLAGGSADRDARRTLGEEYSRGVLSAEDRAQGALADLRSSDEQSRLNLIQMAQSGLSASDAAARAGAAIRSSAQSAKAGAVAEGLGDVFGDTAAIYKKQEEAAARRAGMRAPTGGLYGSPWGR